MNKIWTNNVIWKCVCALLGLFIVFAIAGAAVLFFWPAGGIGSGDADREMQKAEFQSVQPTKAEAQLKAEIRISGTGEVSSETASEEESDLSADYIIPDSDTKLLTDADIEGLSAKELNYAKNEIYARHGRKFDSKELQDYFGSKSWYNGQYSPEEFDSQSDSLLSETEKKNAEFLKAAEDELQPGGYKLDQ